MFIWPILYQRTIQNTTLFQNILIFQPIFDFTVYRQLYLRRVIRILANCYRYRRILVIILYSSYQLLVFCYYKYFGY